MATPCLRCGSLGASATAGACETCGGWFCRQLCRDGHACGRDGGAAAALAALHAQALGAAATLGACRGDHIAEIDQRRAEITNESKRLAAERKCQERKRQRLKDKAGNLSDADLLSIIADRALAKAKAKAKGKAKATAKAKAKAGDAAAAPPVDGDGAAGDGAGDGAADGA